MAPTTAATVHGHQRATETKIESTGGLLTVHGIQFWTIGLELAWGRTPAEVPCIFLVFINFHIYFLHLSIYYHIKNLKIQKYQKNKI